MIVYRYTLQHRQVQIENSKFKTQMSLFKIDLTGFVVPYIIPVTPLITHYTTPS